MSITSRIRARNRFYSEHFARLARFHEHTVSSNYKLSHCPWLRRNATIYMADAPE